MTEEAKKADLRTVQLRRVRLSFSDSLKDAKPTVKDGVPKHAANVILEVDSPTYETNKALITAAIREACDQEWKNPQAYVQIMEDDPKRVAFRKGERFKNQTSGEVYRGYADNWAVTGTGPGGNKNPRRPKLFDRGRRPLKEQATKEQLDLNKFFLEKDIPEIFYSGTICDVILNWYATNEGGRGVFCSIEAVRSLQEGERMASGTYVDADMFDEVDDADSAFDGGAAENDPLG